MTNKHGGGGDKPRVFTTQFRQEAVQLVLRDGKSQAQAARELQIFGSAKCEPLKLTHSHSIVAGGLDDTS